MLNPSSSRGTPDRLKTDGAPPPGAACRRSAESHGLKPVPDTTPISYDLNLHEFKGGLFFSRLQDLIVAVEQRAPIILSDEVRAWSDEIGLFEWSMPYPNGVTERSFSYFPSDHRRHEEIYRCELGYDALIQVGEGVIPKAVFDYIPATMTSVLVESADESREFARRYIDELTNQLAERANSSIAVIPGMEKPLSARLTAIARETLNIADNLGSPSARDLLIRIFVRGEARLGRQALSSLVDHARQLASIPEDPLRHLRKLNVGLLEDRLDTSNFAMRVLRRRIDTDIWVDDFLLDPDSPKGHEAMTSLKDFEGGNYGWVPYTSWQKEACQESMAAARRIVSRARRHSYLLFPRLAWEARRFGNNPSLLEEYAVEGFELGKRIKGANLDVPPGRGLYMSGPIPERQFHRPSGDRENRISSYATLGHSWFSDHLEFYPDSTFIPMRGSFVVINPGEEYYYDGRPYCYVPFNDHLTGWYGAAGLFAKSIVERKIAPCLMALDAEPSEQILDIAKANFTAPRLIQDSLDAGLPPLILGTMSQLFNGMSYAVPLGWGSAMDWERCSACSSWRDAYNRVHWAWLIRDIDHANRGVIEAKIRPLQREDQQIRALAEAYQAQLEIWWNRYASWKNDETPGPIGPPRMLRKVYQAFEAFGDGRATTSPILCAVDRYGEESDPVPLINCATLELIGARRPLVLPVNGDGYGLREISMWNDHIRPRMYTIEQSFDSEGRYELVFLGPEVLTRGSKNVHDNS